MSNPNPQAELAEQLNQKVQVCIRIGVHELCRNYVLTDGQVPESAQEGLQELADAILQND